MYSHHITRSRAHTHNNSSRQQLNLHWNNLEEFAWFLCAALPFRECFCTNYNELDYFFGCWCAWITFLLGGFSILTFRASSWIITTGDSPVNIHTFCFEGKREQQQNHAEQLQNKALAQIVAKVKRERHMHMEYIFYFVKTLSSNPIKPIKWLFILIRSQINQIIQHNLEKCKLCMRPLHTNYDIS